MACEMTFWDFAHAHATGLGELAVVLIMAWVLVCLMRALR